MQPVKNFVCLSEEEQKKEMSAFVKEVKDLIGRVEAQMPV